MPTCLVVKNGSNSFSMFSLGMPTPLSETWITTSSGAVAQSAPRCSPPFGMARWALLSRFTSTWTIWSESISATGSSISFSTRTRTPSSIGSVRSTFVDQVRDVGRLAHHAALAGEVEQAGDDAFAAVGLVDDESPGRRASPSRFWHSSSRMLACSSRMPSGLLTSWAMPAASWPMLASFSHLTSASLALSSERCDSSSSS